MKRVLTCLIFLSALGSAWGQDVLVRATALVPILNSAAQFTPGAGLGAELGWALPDKAWHVRAAFDTSSAGGGGNTYFLTMIRPALAYDAFFGPTAFMSFEVNAGWSAATETNIALVDNRACAGAGTSISFFAGPHVNVRTELNYVELFGLMHALTMSVGFDVIGS